MLLEVKNGPLAGTQIAVRAGEPLLVGRNARATLVVPGDTQISGVHFALEWDGKACRVLDRRSTNGTTLNGHPVTEAVVRDGDLIVAGDTKFVVRIVSGASQPSATAPVSGVSTPPTAVSDRSPAMRTAVPQAPSPGVPSVPSMPGIPVVPGIAALGVPAVLVGATMTGTPAGSQKLLLGLPAMPIALGVHVPQIPPAPVLPGMPSVPAIALPAIPGVPAVPQIPGVAMPAMPRVPSIPNVAVPSVALPQVPAIPSLPALAIPQIPRPVIPTLSAAELAAMIAEAARRALAALWQASLVVGGWKFMVIPKGWVVPEERIGINCAHKGVFPAHILAGEEPLMAGADLVRLRDAHIHMMRQYMHEPRITEQKAPQIPGAGTVLAVDIVYKLDSGAGVLLRRLYAQNGQVAGVLTLMTLLDDFLRILPDLQIIQSNLRFEPKQPSLTAAIPGQTGAQA